MKRLVISLFAASLIAGLVSCTGGTQAPQKPVHETRKVQTAPKAPTVAVQEEEQKKPEYQVTGVRDPFQPFAGINPAQSMVAGDPGKGVDPLQNLSLSQLYLVGVILGKQSKALIQDTSGMGYIVGEGMLIGENNGVVTKITKDSVTVKQHFKDYMGRVTTREVVLALRKEEGGK